MIKKQILREKNQLKDYCAQLQNEIVEFQFQKTNNEDLFANEIPIKKSQIPIVIGWNLESLLKTELSN